MTKKTPRFYLINIIIFFIVLFTLKCSTEKPFPDIDYHTPNRYLSQPDGIGSLKLIDSVANCLTGSGQEDIIANIWYYIQDHLSYRSFNPDQEKYRNFDQLLQDREYTGSASHSVVFGTLCRAKGIPVIWVKSVDYQWIVDFLQQGSAVTYYSAYTYLECYIDDTWKLVDAYSGKIFDQYDPSNPNLPDNRYAFGKGPDPAALVLDTQWKAWQQGTIAAFQGFSQKKLKPVTLSGRDFLLKRFKGKRPSIGVKIQNTEDRQGVIVIQVKRDFPADAAGVLPGDIITKVDNDSISDIFQLVEIIKHKGFDTRFSITVRREKQVLELPAIIKSP